jgi:nickel-dependent lactate racemase
MKKISLALALSTVVLLTSCSSGWSCQKRYCNAKQIKSSKRKIVNMHKKGHQFGALFYVKYFLIKKPLSVVAINFCLN